MVYALLGLPAALWVGWLVVRRRGELAVCWAAGAWAGAMFGVLCGVLFSSTVFIRLGLDPTTAYAGFAERVLGGVGYGVGLFAVASLAAAFVEPMPDPVDDGHAQAAPALEQRTVTGQP